MRLLGRSSSEGPLLPLLRDEIRRVGAGDPPRTAVIRQIETHAVVGLATWGHDPLWPETVLTDVYCHPAFWKQAPELLARIHPIPVRRCIAYCDAGVQDKESALAEAGYSRVSTLPAWVARDRAQSGWKDVGVWQKQ